jgi:hypothetical protein
MNTQLVNSLVQIIESLTPEERTLLFERLSRPLQELFQPRPAPAPSPAADDLRSDVGADYYKLRDLLKAGNWKEADGETQTVMLKVAGREKEGWLRVEDIEKFPCIDLCTIDTLWGKYSKGRFGFSVQKRIWESVGGTPNADNETYDRFGDRVGWRVNNYWLNYNQLTFSVKAQEGHFPRRWDRNRLWDLGGDWWLMVGRRVDGGLFSRLETCQL